MCIATSLTLLRLFISPIFLLFYAYYPALDIPLPYVPYLLLTVVMISEATDILDGIFARRFNQVTDLGKLLDPMADSIYRISIFFTLTLPPVQLPMWIVFVFLYRDSMVTTLRSICALKGFALAARSSGKLKAVIQAAAIISILFLIIPYSVGDLSQENLKYYSMIITSFAACYTLLSGIDYFVANRSYLAKILAKPSHAR